MAKKNNDGNIGLVGAILVIGGIGILVGKIKEYPFYFVMGVAGIIAIASGCWYLYLKFIKEKAGNGASPLLLNLSKWISIVFCAVFLFVGIGLSTGLIKNNSATQEDVVKTSESTENNGSNNSVTSDSSELQDTLDQPSETATEDQPKSDINTSDFVYAQSTKITDARDITNHVTVSVYYSSELSVGLAAQHTLTGAYQFLQQPSLKNVNTIDILIMQNDMKTCSIAVDMNKFNPTNSDTEEFIPTVMKASEFTYGYDQVKDFGEASGWW